MASERSKRRDLLALSFITKKSALTRNFEFLKKNNGNPYKYSGQRTGSLNLVVLMGWPYVLAFLRFRFFVG